MRNTVFNYLLLPLFAGLSFSISAGLLRPRYRRSRYRWLASCRPPQPSSTSIPPMH